MIVRMSDRGQIVIPADVRHELKLEPGHRMQIEIQDGHVILQPLPMSPLVAARGRYRGAPLTEILLEERKRDG